jgi:hypothetical protein
VYRGELTALQVMALEAGCQVYDGLAHMTEQAVAMIPGLGLAPELAGAIRRATVAVAGRAPLTWASCGSTAG